MNTDYPHLDDLTIVDEARDYPKLPKLDSTRAEWRLVDGLYF